MSTVIIAGGATGIGRAAVRGFRARGDNVLLVDHRPQGADLVDEVAPGAIRFIQRDLADPQAPSQVVAAAVERFGSVDTLPSFGGWQGGRQFVFSECVMGTWGATSRHDGQEGVPHMASNQANVPIEMIEADYPLRIESYGFVADTGGPGKFRGGLSLERSYRILADDVYFGVRSDKTDFAPHGLSGGEPGQPARNLLLSHGAQRRLPAMPTEAITLSRGDLYVHRMAGGGGFGPAHERDPEQVRADVLDDKVSVACARDTYGVVLGEGPRCTVDQEATRMLRETRR